MKISSRRHLIKQAQRRVAFTQSPQAELLFVFQHAAFLRGELSSQKRSFTNRRKLISENIPE
jgi:hypothetical protein